jgi:hypothetical protein
MRHQEKADRTLTALSRILRVGRSDDHHTKIRRRVVPGIREPGRRGPRGVPERTRAMTLDTSCRASVTLSLHGGVWTPASAYVRAPDEF